jgi:hypothetical protein
MDKPYISNKCKKASFILPAEFSFFIIINKSTIDNVNIFILPAEFSSFIIINESRIDNVKNLISSFGLKKGELWKYDPYHIISEQRMKVGLPPYQHFSNYSIEILENKST